MSVKLLKLAFLLGICAVFVQAEVDPHAELRDIQSAIKGVRASLAQAEEKQTQIEQDIKSQTSRLQELEKNREQTTRRLEEMEQARESLRKEIGSAQSRIETVSGRVRKRVRSLYLRSQHNSSFLSLLGKSRNPSIKSGVYLEYIHRHDQQTLDHLGDLIDDHAKKITRLNHSRVKHQKLLVKRHAEEFKLAAVLGSLERLAEELEENRKNNRRSLNRLLKKKSQVENVLKRITQTRSSVVEKGIKLPGLATYKAWPVAGRVLRKFGPYRLKGLGDKVFHKGISFEAGPDRPVRVIETGRVQFIGEVPGYGLVVIVDHGKRDYSLYGRIGVATVEVGQTLKRGDILGRSNLEPSDDGNFYFEVRRGGKALNPEKVVHRISATHSRG